MSIPCFPWRSWQRVNFKTIPVHEGILKAKREESLVLIESVKKMLDSTKAEVYFERPKNDGWRQSVVEDLLKRLPYSTEVDGCAYNSKNSDRRYKQKIWKIASTHRKVKNYLNINSCHNNKHLSI
jgi:hypothetical protein